MRQIKYEMLKHLNKFNLIFIAAMLVLNLAVALFQYIEHLSPQAAIIRQAKADLFYDYANNREKFDEEYYDFRAREAEFESLLRQAMFSGEPFFLSFMNQKIDLDFYGDRHLYRDVMAIINRNENHSQRISRALRESHAILRNLVRNLGIQRGQFLYEYQIAIILRYSRVAELEITPENQYGWSEFFSLQTPVIFLAITFMGVFVNIFIVEKRTRIVSILNICKNGRVKLTISKLLIITIFSISLTLLFSLSPLIIFSFTTGLSNPAQYVQALSILELCPYILTIWQYLFIFILVKIVIFLLFALFVAILGQIWCNEVFVFSTGFLFLILNYLLSLVDVNSPLFFLRRFNFFDLAFVNILFERYRGLNIFNFHIAFLHFFIAFACVILMALIVLSIILKLRNASGNFITLKAKKMKPVKLKGYGETSILMFEFYKYLLNKRRVLILIIAVVIKIIISSVYFTPIVTNQGNIYRNYIERLRGELTGAQSEFIREEREFLNRAVAEHDIARSLFRDGEIELSEFQIYNQRFNYVQSVEYSFERVEERYHYLLSVLRKPEYYSNIEFIYEAGVLLYFFSLFDVILVLFAVAIFADIFSNEYQSGFIMILSISKNGGKKTFNAKYLFGFITITVAYLIFLAIDLFFLLRNFNIDYFHAGIMSIPDFARLEMNISILEYFIIFNIISYIGFIILTLIIISMSSITSNLLKSALASIFIIFVPFFLENFDVDVLKFMNIVSLLNPTYIVDYILQYIFYIILCIGLIILSRRRWIK